MNEVQIIELPKISDVRGNLTVVEEFSEVPFLIKRTYFLYDVPSGAERGGHAHKKLRQLIIALSGSFDVILDDGHEVETFHLNRPNIGLLLGPMKWRVINNFSSGSVCAVMASDKYDEDDYIRSHDEFVGLVV